MRRTVNSYTSAAWAALSVLLIGCLAIASSQVNAQAAAADLPYKARQMALEFALSKIDELAFDTVVLDDFVPIDLSWSHRRGKFELLYRLIPDSSVHTTRPAITAGALAVHCTDNTSEDFVGRWRAGSEDLDRLGAEWAYFWDYAPKQEFSSRRRCYQASYYASGRGLVHAWLLYDDPEFLHSDWVYVLPFSSSE